MGVGARTVAMEQKHSPDTGCSVESWTMDKRLIQSDRVVYEGEYPVRTDNR